MCYGLAAHFISQRRTAKNSLYGLSRLFDIFRSDQYPSIFFDSIFRTVTLGSDHGRTTGLSFKINHWETLETSSRISGGQNECPALIVFFGQIDTANLADS